MTELTLTLDELLKLGSKPDPQKLLTRIRGTQAELEESVALALQNYRQGLTTADDFISFLLPTKLEEGVQIEHMQEEDTEDETNSA